MIEVPPKKYAKNLREAEAALGSDARTKNGYIGSTDEATPGGRGCITRLSVYKRAFWKRPQLAWPTAFVNYTGRLG